MKFKYSLNEDIKEAKNMLASPDDYKNLISVVWPHLNPINSLKYFVFGKFSILRAKYVWFKHKSEIEEKFKELKLKLPNVTCYIHNISCQGWFEIDKNLIHVRFTKSSNNDLCTSIVHELIHMATYKSNYSYSEREKIVDKYLQNANFSFVDFKKQTLI